MPEQESPAPEAGDDLVTSATEAQTASDQEEGQVSDPPAEQDAQPEAKAPEEADSEEKSKAQQRRERRKAYLEQLQQKERDARERLERIKRAASDDKEPNQDEYDDLTEYAAARALWKQARNTVDREQSALTEDMQRIEQERRTALIEAHNERMAEAKSRYTDFEQVVLQRPWNVAEHVQAIALSSDHSADIAYHLASNPAEAMRLSYLHPVEAAREIGRLEAAYSSQSASRRTSSAPEPIRPVSPRSSVSKDPAKMSYSEYRKWREAGGA